MITVVTSYGHEGAALYGHRFVAQWWKHWPEKDRLVCYVESEVAEQPGSRIEMRNLLGVSACAAFLARHRGSAAAHGRKPQPVWRQKERDAGYSFRTDAYKFCRKVFAVRDAARFIDDGVLAWLDADVVTTTPVPDDFVEDLLGSADVAYLGRGRAHSECGFLAFRLPAARPVIETWAALYATDGVFSLPEWHDSFVFDVARRACPDVECRDLTPGGSGHVWCRSPLARYLDHLKGDERKRLGYSPELRQHA